MLVVTFACYIHALVKPMRVKSKPLDFRVPEVSLEIHFENKLWLNQRRML